ncbi:MAG: ParA family protein [Gammaproteobacteria bacterium]|nr:ParA family protein [Gammaproteobacteria bacterium]
MKIWAVANQKGGVGKTTTAVSLAGHLVELGFRVLLVDMDPQGSMTSYFGYDPDNMPKSIYSLFQLNEYSYQHVAPVLIDTKVERLKLLPASTALATLDRQLGAKEGKGLVLKKSLMAVEEHFDFVLIDCLPMLGLLMVNALAACDTLLLPVQTEFLALKGLDRMMNTLNMVIKSRKSPLNFVIVPTMFDRRTRASTESLEALRNQYAERVWDSVIPVDTQFREASRQGLPISLMNRSTRGSQAYEALLHALLRPAQERHLKLVRS